MLSQIVMFTENDTNEQTSEVLHRVTSYFKELANFVNETDVIINTTVSQSSLRTNYLIIMPELFTGNF